MSTQLNCEPWTKLRLPCPYVLIEAMKEGENAKEEDKQEEEIGEPSKKTPWWVAPPARQRPPPSGGEGGVQIPFEERKGTTVVYSNEQMATDIEKLLQELAKRESERQVGVEAGWQLPPSWTTKAEELGYKGVQVLLIVAAAAAMIALTRGRSSSPHAIPALITFVLALPEHLAPGGVNFNPQEAIETVIRTTSQTAIGGGSGTWVWFHGTEG